MGTQNAPFFALVWNLLSKLKNSINETSKVKLFKAKTINLSKV